MKKLSFLVLPILLAFTSPVTDYRTQYLADSLAEALLVESIYEVPYELTLAQSAHESGWGSSYNARYRCNYFGITNGRGDYIVFDSKEDSFKAYGRLISNRYDDCLVPSAKESISCIHDSGYAEDLEYTFKLLRLFRQVSGMV